MIRSHLYIFACVAILAVAFTGPVLAQNLFLHGKNGESESRPAPKKKGFFSKLFFGEEKEKNQKKQAVKSINGAMAALDPDMLDQSGKAPTTAAEYLARADALSAASAQSYKQEKALSNKRSVISNKVFKERAKAIAARTSSNTQNNTVKPVTFQTQAPQTQTESQKVSTTKIRSKSPLLNNIEKNKQSSDGGVFKKY